MKIDFSELQFSPTAWLFEGAKAGAGVSMFITRTRPGGFVELHVHPYTETFLLLEGHGRWTAGDAVEELIAEQMIVVAAAHAARLPQHRRRPAAGRLGPRGGHAATDLPRRRARMSERVPRIGIVGTFDLENYGDLLFPILAEFELRERFGDVELRPFSYHAKSPPDWPFAVDSVLRLPELVEDLDGLLIGGGFLIRFDKDVAPGYGPPSDHIHHPTGNWLTPGLMAQQHGVPVALNAPGLHLNEVPAWAEPLLRQLLVGSGYVSVRDEPSAAALAGVAPVDISVVPDTAFGLGRLLAAEVAPTEPASPYVVVQAAASEQPFCQWWADHAAALGDRQAVLLPVSPVLGESTEPLSAILEAATAAPFSGPLTIARLVAGADAVIGHSYHLAITALCAGVPVFTPADLSVGKFSALEGLDGIHPAPQGADDPAAFVERLGRADVQPEIEHRVNRLAGHWDRIAEVMRGDAPPSPRLNRMWQSLPGWLETAAPPPAAPAAPDGREAEVAFLHGEVQAQRARTTEVEGLLRLARDELAAREPRRRGPSLPPRLRRSILELRPLRDPEAGDRPVPVGDGRRPVHARRRRRARRHLSPRPLQAHRVARRGEGLRLPRPVADRHGRHEPRARRGAQRRLAQARRRPPRAGLSRGDVAAGRARPVRRAARGQRHALRAGLRARAAQGPAREARHPRPVLQPRLERRRRRLPVHPAQPRPGRRGHRIRPVVGNSAVIVRSDDSWHAVDPVVADGRLSRRSVTVTFHAPGSVSSMWPRGDPSPLIDYRGADVSV